MCSSSQEESGIKPTEIFQKSRNLFKFQTPLVWRNILGILAIHLFTIYGFTDYPFRERGYFVALWGLFIGLLSGLGVTAGAHRLWTHRTYKAKLPLRIFLMICFLITGQYSMVQWARDHRLHHKFSDTDADPHNSKRGFFFSHCGWLMMKRHPESKKKGKCIDVTDLWEDPVVAFQQKYFVPLLIFFFIVIPCGVQHLIFGDSLFELFYGIMCLRYILQLHNTWIVNSIAHIWGYRPYNRNIEPVDNKIVSWFTLGEGFHNYHHVFPWDYRAAEFGMEPNFTTMWINLFCKLGLAYDVKSASSDMVQKVIARSGGVLDPNVEISEEEAKKLL